MKWDEFVKDRCSNIKYIFSEDNFEPTNIECPKCGATVYRDLRYAYASFPPKCRYICKECDWSDYA
jgi:transposase-like protein